jgi:Holliday junction resolvasome RuvABC endonuclease subunit
MQRVLSLDISSTTLGWAVLGTDGQKICLLDVGFIKPEKQGTLYERLTSLKKEMTTLFNRVKPHEIAIEDIALFMPRKSTAHTIVLLAVFNRMVSLLAYEYLGKDPKHYPVMTIRNGLKMTTVAPDKMEMPALVEKHLKIKIPKKLKKSGNPTDEYYDQADAIAVGLYHSYLVTNQLKSIPKVPVKSKKKTRPTAKRKKK